jgi:hypothetical protein
MKKTAALEVKQVDEIAQPAAETAQPPEGKTVAVKTKLSGPKPLFCCHTVGGGRSPPCSLKLPPEILDLAGMRPNDEVELISSEGQIIIKRIGIGHANLQAYVGNADTQPKKGTVLAELMRLGREKDEEMKRRRAGGEWDEDEGEDEN